MKTFASILCLKESTLVMLTDGLGEKNIIVLSCVSRCKGMVKILSGIMGLAF